MFLNTGLKSLNRQTAAEHSGREDRAAGVMQSEQTLMPMFNMSADWGRETS